MTSRTFDSAPPDSFPSALGRWQPQSLRSTVTLLATILVIRLVLRIVLWWSFGRQAGIVPGRLPLLLGTGSIADLRVALLLALPLALWSNFSPSRWRQSKLYAGVKLATLLMVNIGLVYTAFAEYYFFEEFNARFNLVAVDYLMYPHEVLGNIRDSYPVAGVLLLTAAIAVMIVPLQLATLREGRLRAGARPERLASLALFGCALALSMIVPLSAAGTNRIEREIASNGLALFFDALRTHDLRYTDHYRSMDSSAAVALVREELTGAFEGRQPGLRQVRASRPDGLGHMNVVVVVEESLGCEYVGACGDSRGLTPSLDRIASDGVFFQQVWATGTRTVRGLEAITASFPPIPSESIVKRPGGDRLDNWGRIMQSAGYKTSFLYGGYAFFDGMTNFFASNGFKIIDRKNFNDPQFSNIWGVSDEDLFANALSHFDERAASGGPFFSVVLSTSNHKPFTFRPGVPGVPEKGGGREAGIRYADFALGRFIEDARKHPWFDDTLFIIVADHGARVYGREEIPMETYRIPLVFYAPSRLVPRRVTTPVSQMDIAPTVLGMLGIGYEGELLGRDVFRESTRRPTILLSHNHDVARFDGESLVVLGLKGSVHEYRYDLAMNTQVPEPVDARRVDLAVAWYQSAANLLESRREQ